MSAGAVTAVRQTPWRGAFGGLSLLLWAISPFAILLLVWQLAVIADPGLARTTPAPLSVWREFLTTAANGILPTYIVVSLGRWAAGAAAGLIAGVVLAILLGSNRQLRILVMPVARFFSGIAELSFLPLLVLWFGFGFTAMVALIAYSVLFPVLYNTLQALESIQPSLVNAVRTLGGTGRQVLTQVRIPGAVSGIVTGFRIGAGYAFRALIAAEIFASNSGLGYMIFQSRETLNISRMFVGMAVIGFIWLFIDNFYLKPFEAATVRRWGLERAT